MSVITFPSTIKVSKQTWIQQRNDVEFRSMFGAQAVEVTAPLWATAIYGPTDMEIYGGAFQAVIMQLRGRTNQLALWNMGRPVPLGTMRGSMTLGATSQGATSLVISATGQVGATLVAGDYLGVGSGLTQQVVMVTAAATSDGSGNITVTVEPPLRNAFTAGAAVTWNYRCALFRRKSSTAQWDYEPKIVSGLMLDLLEDNRP
jgi:hypothetical protein